MSASNLEWNKWHHKPLQQLLSDPVIIYLKNTRLINLLEFVAAPGLKTRGSCVATGGGVGQLPPPAPSWHRKKETFFIKLLFTMKSFFKEFTMKSFFKRSLLRKAFFWIEHYRFWNSCPLPLENLASPPWKLPSRTTARGGGQLWGKGLDWNINLPRFV